MKRLLPWIVLLLSACAATPPEPGTSFAYNGQRYADPFTLQDAVSRDIAAALALVTPLKASVNSKTLVVVVPETEMLTAMGVADFESIQNRPPRLGESLVITQNAVKCHKLLVALGQALQKRNIYSSTRIVFTDHSDDTLLAAPSNDVLYFQTLAVNETAWHMAIFNAPPVALQVEDITAPIDRQIVTMLDAVALQAIRHG